MDALESGIAAIRQGDKSLGCQHLCEWLKDHPDHAEAYHLLGCTLASLHRTDDAIAALNAGISANESYAPLQYSLGTLLLLLGQLEAAEEHLKAATVRDPTSAAAWSNLCATSRTRGNLAQAELAGRRATKLDPSFASGWVNLGNTLKDQSRLQDAIATYERAASIHQQAGAAASNGLLARCYIEPKPDALSAAHRNFGKRLGVEFSERPFLARHENPRIRVGYVSADFRLHSVMYFFGSLLKGHDRSRFDLYLYSDVECADGITGSVQQASTQWANCNRLTDEELWAKIREDNIDVLVDLSGHTGHRLGVFARRAAPTQVTWLGYPFSTGLDAMDFRITDSIADPNDSDEWYTEQLLRLQGPFLCYQPPAGSPEVAPAPVQKNGYITFGSFNHLAKLSDDTVVLFSAILQECEGSKLYLKCKSLSDGATAKATVERFMRYGISPQQLILHGHVSNPTEHLAAYAEVDIALDPLPYNGTTTTFEALWMGVPVLALSGHWHASRVGASVMSHLGLTTLVASNPNTLLTLARELSGQRETLVELRSILRQLLLKSPLCDTARFSRNFEAALVSAVQARAAVTHADTA